MNKKMSKAAFKEHCWGLAFVAPPFIGFCIFMAFPIVYAFIASLTKWIGMNNMMDNFVGFANYIKLFQDAKFWKVLLNTIIYMIIFMVWKGLGTSIILYLSGLQGIPRDYYEAAMIDGAKGWQLFKNITWPLVSPVTFYLLITGLIGGFQVFVEIVVMVPNGGLNYSAATVVFYLYEKAFSNNQMGYASAIAFILAIIIFIITAIQFKGQDKWVKTIE